jgi:hypothetical protein
MAGQRFGSALRDAGWTFVGNVAFPRLSHRLRWPTRLGPRGLLLYVAFNTALGTAVRVWVVPFFTRLSEEREQTKDELRRQLGREPTDEELAARILARFQVPG